MISHTHFSGIFGHIFILHLWPHKSEAKLYSDRFFGKLRAFIWYLLFSTLQNAILGTTLRLLAAHNGDRIHVYMRMSIGT